ncbi:hypothetical protein BamIOP4010DRAFT_5762 [Burkholderia ambifaria IOP40-10]|uniref:Uncharacterized protein n=1 Tax=Burkholderia ambifaria IOP40-10 TaxID=396596 RepID=B1FP01_9BURK|nr:hypothetical protein BamIOP4010DRAFT_5762 [Burkholderia ambifaria IOP40-10]
MSRQVCITAFGDVPLGRCRHVVLEVQYDANDRYRVVAGIIRNGGWHGRPI